MNKLKTDEKLQKLTYLLRKNEIYDINYDNKYRLLVKEKKIWKN